MPRFPYNVYPYCVPLREVKQMNRDPSPLSDVWRGVKLFFGGCIVLPVLIFVLLLGCGLIGSAMHH